jgi:two-component system sensor histidine kinase HydH
MSILSQSALIASIVLLALSAGVLLSGRKARPFLYFSLLTFILSIWELARFLSAATHAVLWTRVGLTAALFLPFAALRFFESWLSAQGRVARWATRVIGLVTLTLIPVAFSPLWSAPWFGVVLLAYVYSGLLVCIVLIWLRLRRSRGPVESGRVQFLAFGGLTALALAFPAYIPDWSTSLLAADYLPAAGNAVLVIFLYFLSQILLQSRLLDVSELIGKLAVLTGLVLLLSAIWGVLVIWTSDTGGLFFFHTLIAAFVLLILFEPMRTAMEETVNRLLFRDRFRFIRQLALLRREIANVVELDELVQALLRHLEETRRVTHASLYALEDDALHLRLAGSLHDAPPRLEVARHRRFLDALKRERLLVLEDLEDALADLDPEDAEDRPDAALLQEIIAVLRQLRAAICLPLLSDDRVIGLLNLNDDRMRAPYAAEDVRALVQIAAQAAISLENSRLVRNLRERDRLAALGEMAAGLAHEIRNPLGAIKGAAQYLAFIEPNLHAPPSDDEDEEPPEAFLNIIIDETNRLNNVVSQFLDYARPQQGELTPCAVLQVVERTLPLASPEAEAWGVDLQAEVAPDLPHAQGNPERLRQVLLNLLLNAVQASGAPPGEAPTRPHPHVTLRAQLTRRAFGAQPRDLLEITVEDNGCGIPPEHLPNLFIPFFTTRSQGTGLGLAVSQRLIEQMGGRIEVDSTQGEGATFRVLLPVWEG